MKYGCSESWVTIKDGQHISYSLARMNTQYPTAHVRTLGDNGSEHLALNFVALLETLRTVQADLSDGACMLDLLEQTLELAMPVMH
ncbi:hypothetical protein D3C80_1563150 [compost metagenome]